MFNFSIKHRDGKSRVGVIDLGYLKVQTPVFMPVGTQGTVKALLPEMLENIGVSIMLSNTYHLYLRPGVDVIEKLGGLHRFTGWKRGILTDSGGFQVFSLKGLTTVSVSGVSFRSHIDGSLHFLTPEDVIQLQYRWGSDIAMVLDECPPYGSSLNRIAQSLNITLKWAERSIESRKLFPVNAMFGIVQGGVFEELRREAAHRIGEMEFDGIAIGGLSVGEPTEETYRACATATEHLPEDKPRYAMGIGKPEDIIEMVSLGIDMFDCVIPTRNARNGSLFTDNGILNIKRSEFASDSKPIDEHCRCYTCTRFSRAYLRHLYKAGELSFYTLATIHNIYYYTKLMERIRKAIRTGEFSTFKRRFYERYKVVRQSSE